MCDKNTKKKNEDLPKIKLSSGVIILAIICLSIFIAGQILSIIFMRINNIDGLIGALSSFYSILFTIVAIFIGIAAIIGWNWVKDVLRKETDKLSTEWAAKEKLLNNRITELTEKLEKFNKIENDVDFLRKKNDLAEWVESKFENDIDKKILTSISFVLTTEEEKKLKEIKDHILKETTDDSWLKLVYAQRLLEELKKNRSTEENEFKKIENIFNYIEFRDLFEEGSEIPQLLYHYKGLLFLFWYQNKKNEFVSNRKDEKAAIPMDGRWPKMKDSENDYTPIRLLEVSVKSYEKSLELAKKNGAKNVDETQGNLSVVLVELSKFEQKPGYYLNQAIDYLKKIKNKTFNTYWDKARVLYYLDSKRNWDEIEKLLSKASEAIYTLNDKEFFLNRLDGEIKEKGLSFNIGFPGDEALIRKQKEYLDRKYLT